MTLLHENVPTSDSEFQNNVPSKFTYYYLIFENIYTISNTVLVDLDLNDQISLMFWSEDIGTRIGDPIQLTGKLPNGNSVPEATASIVFTKIA